GAPVGDVGGVGRRGGAAREVDALAREAAARLRRQRELGELLLLAGAALEGAREARRQVAPLGSLGGDVEGQVQVPARHRGLVAEGLVEDRLRVLAAAAAAEAAGNGERDGQREDRRGEARWDSVQGRLRRLVGCVATCQRTLRRPWAGRE